MSAHTRDISSFPFCFLEPFSHLPHKLFAGTTNIPLISHSQTIVAVPPLLPSLYELRVSHICSPSIIAVWCSHWKAAGGERQHLQSNREEQCEISGRGSFPHARGQGIRRWGSLPQTLNTSHWHPDASSMQTHPSHVSVSQGVKLYVCPHSVTALWSACYATAVVLLEALLRFTVSRWCSIGGGRRWKLLFFSFFLPFSWYCFKQADGTDPIEGEKATGAIHLKV